MFELNRNPNQSGALDLLDLLTLAEESATEKITQEKPSDVRRDLNLRLIGWLAGELGGTPEGRAIWEKAVNGAHDSVTRGFVR